MATTKVVSIIARAQIILKDTAAVRWPVLELQDWLNDSYREIVSLHPDANAQTGTFTCVAGYRQSLEASYPNAYKILEVISNKAATSNKKFVKLVSRASMDTMRPNWYNETASVNVQKYMYDKRVPKDFLVYPPATTAAQLEIIYATVPAPHALTKAQLENPATVETINLDDIYSNPMLDYILYRAFSKDSVATNNATMAVAHYQAMVASLNFKVQSDENVAPGSS
jgi:hypothetical protein